MVESGLALIPALVNLNTRKRPAQSKLVSFYSEQIQQLQQ